MSSTTIYIEFESWSFFCNVGHSSNANFVFENGILVNLFVCSGIEEQKFFGVKEQKFLVYW